MRHSDAYTTTPHSTAGATLTGTRTWRWRASTCHRDPAYPSLADRCGWGGRSPPTACALYPSPCTIPREALSLLLTCRQTYREVAPVLYGANTLHISTGALVLYTERLVPAARAREIRRLVYRLSEESAWTHAREELGIEPGPEAYRVLLGRVPEAFPGLRGLEVVVIGLLHIGVEGVSIEGAVMRGCVLEGMDGVVRRFGGELRECVLVLGAVAYDRLMEEERVVAERVEMHEGRWLQFWRPVRVVLEGGMVVETGYWVRRVFEGTIDAEMDLQLEALSLAI